jgi:predicted RNA methylase
MTSIDAAKPLRLASELVIGLESDDAVSLSLGGRTARFPRRALLALAAVAQAPRPFRDIVQRLTGAAATRLDWIEASGLVARLRDFGALTDGSDGPRERRDLRLSGRDVEMHIELLDDRDRTLAFIRAIEEAVRPGDVVVDLGTGTAVLAMAAARAGAKRVYAIEASAFADVAERIIEANGFGDRITVVRGWSYEVHLPERADVLVSEIVGNDPLGEGALRYMPDAVERFLKPSARILPAKLRVMAALVDVPAEDWGKQRVTSEALRIWRDAYGFDFTPFRDATEGIVRPFYRLDREMEGWPWIGQPTALFETALGEVVHGERSCRAVLEVTDPVRHLGVVVYSVLDFGAGLVYDTHPAKTRCSNWRVPIRLVPMRSAPGVGARIEVSAKWSSWHNQIKVELRALLDKRIG